MKTIGITGYAVAGDPTPHSFAFPIRVRQTSKNRFTVVYGKEIRENLTLGDAADALGRSIMHVLSCDGLIENE
jgi:hypothetical protein